MLRAGPLVPSSPDQFHCGVYKLVRGRSASYWKTPLFVLIFFEGRLKLSERWGENLLHFRQTCRSIGWYQCVSSLQLRDSYWRYNGSLTTPFCNESVIWTLFTSTVSVSHEQVCNQIHFTQKCYIRSTHFGYKKSCPNLIFNGSLLLSRACLQKQSDLSCHYPVSPCGYIRKLLIDLIFKYQKIPDHGFYNGSLWENFFSSFFSWQSFQRKSMNCTNFMVVEYQF